jgi:hypothetical protein
MQMSDIADEKVDDLATDMDYVSFVAYLIDAIVPVFIIVYYLVRFHFLLIVLIFIGPILVFNFFIYVSKAIRVYVNKKDIKAERETFLYVFERINIAFRIFYFLFFLLLLPTVGIGLVRYMSMLWNSNDLTIYLNLLGVFSGLPGLIYKFSVRLIKLLGRRIRGGG